MMKIEPWLAEGFVPDLVSVIIPTYNRAHFLLDTLESVVAQSYRPIEVHLVDDGSTDNTQALMDQFIERHKQDEDLSIHCHWCEKAGASPARNFGLTQSRGEFIQFLDSDDVLHPEKLSTQVRSIRKNKVDFVWSSTIPYRGTPDWSAQPLFSEPMKGSSARDFICRFIQQSCWRTESGLYTRFACIKTGPWHRLAMFQDWEYNIRMLSWGARVYFEPGNLAAENQHDQGRIGDKWSNGSGLQGALQAIRLVEKHTAPLFSADPKWQKIIEQRYIEVDDQMKILGLG